MTNLCTEWTCKPYMYKLMDHGLLDTCFRFRTTHHFSNRSFIKGLLSSVMLFIRRIFSWHQANLNT